MEQISNILSYPSTWLIWGTAIFLGTFLIDAIDHGIFLGLPAFAMPLFCSWVTPVILTLLIYAAITLLFYKFCGRFRDWFHGTSYDVNDD
jgi:hypothetical protein